MPVFCSVSTYLVASITSSKRVAAIDDGAILPRLDQLLQQQDVLLPVASYSDLRAFVSDPLRQESEHRGVPHEAEIRLDEHPARFQGAAAASERVLADGVEDDVVGLAVLREVFLQCSRRLRRRRASARGRGSSCCTRLSHGRRSTWPIARQPFRSNRTRRRRRCSVPSACPRLGGTTARSRPVADRGGFLEAHRRRASTRAATLRNAHELRVRATLMPKMRSPTLNSVTAGPTARPRRPAPCRRSSASAERDR